MGYSKNGTKFSLAVSGKKITGFHGSYGQQQLHSLGAYFTMITPTRLDEKGGKGGIKWDDGSDHYNVSKIHVRGGLEGIQFIKFDYVKKKQVQSGSIHGDSSRGFTQTYEINSSEYLVCVEGYYDDVSGVIQGLRFQTNIQTSGLIGYNKGKKFTLASNGLKIIGFHGYAEKNLNSLGIYVTTTVSTKLACQADPRGCLWDYGYTYDGIRKVFVDVSEKSDELNSVIRCIRCEYDNGGKVDNSHTRRGFKDEKEFAIDYPNEFLTSVEGTLRVQKHLRWIMSVTFKTSKGRISPIYGTRSEIDEKFTIEKEGNAIVGFHGWTDLYDLTAIGAYYRPFPPPPLKKDIIEAKGGDGGASWDDGSFEGVRRIYIGLNQNAVAFIKFIYYKNSQMFFGEDHGNKTNIGVQEFELDFPREYLTSVEASYGTESKVITMLRFKTNKHTSPDFGVSTTANSSYVLHKDDHKIVGFYGKSSNMLHEIKAHFAHI